MTNHEHRSRKTYTVTLLGDGEAGITTRRIGEYTVSKTAMEAAERAAGAGAAYEHRGASYGYTGAKGFASVVETIGGNLNLNT